MKKQFIDTGEIVAPHGIKGEVRVYPWTDDVEFLCAFKRLYLDANGTREIKIERARMHKNVVVMKIAGVDTVEDAQKYRGKTIYLKRDDCELDEGDYFVQDLIGMKVQDVDTGEVYGEITDVSQTGANDVYHIGSEEKPEKLIPAIKDVVKSTDLNANVMLIRPLEGLFDED